MVRIAVRRDVECGCDGGVVAERGDDGRVWVEEGDRGMRVVKPLVRRREGREIESRTEVLVGVV